MFTQFQVKIDKSLMNVVVDGEGFQTEWCSYMFLYCRLPTW